MTDALKALSKEIWLSLYACRKERPEVWAAVFPRGVNLEVREAGEEVTVILGSMQKGRDRD